MSKSRITGTSKLIHSVYGFKSPINFPCIPEFHINNDKFRKNLWRSCLKYVETDWLIVFCNDQTPSHVLKRFICRSLGDWPSKSVFYSSISVFYMKKEFFSEKYYQKIREKFKRTCVGIIVKTFSSLLSKFSMILQWLTLKSVITTTI